MSRHEIDPVTREPFEQQPADATPHEDVRVGTVDSRLRERLVPHPSATPDPADAAGPVDVARH
jgi:hypothetical protein